MCWGGGGRESCLQIIALEGKSALRIYDQNSARPLHADKNGNVAKIQRHTQRGKRKTIGKH